MSQPDQILLLGVGPLGSAIIRLAKESYKITASTRNPNKIFYFSQLGITPLIMPLPSAEIIESLAKNTNIIVTFPPDGSTDAILAPACAQAKRLIYISSTSVYGAQSGTINDTSSVDHQSSDTKLRLEAENIWRKYNGIILRAPGIYGPTNGMHIRLKNKSYKLPGTGQNMSSRIHVDDLAAIILAIIKAKQLSKNTYLVSDQKPCSHLELSNWLCDKMEIPKPASANLEELHPTLRSNRSIDGSALLNELGISLQYPSYKEGYAQCLEVAASTADP